MTLTVFDELEQGSDAWLDQRRGLITASVIGQLITPKTLKPAANPAARSLTTQLIAERVTGWTEDVWVTDDMQRGNDDEPRARDKYAEHYGVEVTETGFMVREFDNGYRLGFSPDGLVGSDGLIEIKSRKPKKQLETILANSVPLENVAQCQAGLLVSGRKWLDYVSYAGGMPMFVTRVFPDDRWFEAIEATVQAFEESAAVMVAMYEVATKGLATTERLTYQALELKLA